MSIVSPPPDTTRHPDQRAALRPTATVPAPVPQLSALDAGSQLEAVVRQVLGSGRFEIDTQFGPLVLHTRAPLPEGARLALDITQSGKVIQMVITEVDGKAISENTPASPGKQGPENSTLKQGPGTAPSNRILKQRPQTGS